MSTDVAGLTDALSAELGAASVSTDPQRRRAASTDWAHMSPVLAAMLPAGLADVVVTPTSADGIAAAVGLAHRFGVPVTPRGKGTGNYGQGIPLADGLVLDTSRCTRVLEVGDGWIRAEAGTSFVALEAAARGCGQELAMFPSTVGSALGGFLAGGAGGTGSVEHGLLWDGSVHAVDVVACTDAAERTVLTGDESLPLLHAYGTTGVLATATVQLCPRRDWTALFASFPVGAEAAAVAAGRALMVLDPVPRLISLDEPGIVAAFPADPAMPPERHSLRAIIDTCTVAAAGSIVAAAGGRTDDVRARAPALLTSLSFNHTTHRVQKTTPGMAHLQVGGRALTDRIAEVRALFVDPLVHLDAIAGDGGADFNSLMLCRYQGAAELYAGMDALRELGCHLSDPHTWLLDPTADQRAAAARFDPDGLLNPGKLR